MKGLLKKLPMTDDIYFCLIHGKIIADNVEM